MRSASPLLATADRTSLYGLCAKPLTIPSNTESWNTNPQVIAGLQFTPTHAFKRWPSVTWNRIYCVESSLLPQVLIRALTHDRDRRYQDASSGARFAIGDGRNCSP